MSRDPIIGITVGDAAGIGPEIVLKAIATRDRPDRYVLIGDRAHLKQVAARFVPELDFDALTVHDLHNLPEIVPIGNDSPVTGKAAAENIVAAVDLWRVGEIDAICTAPISKRAINMADFDFPGHTEMLAKLTGTEEFAMSFFAGKLRVVLLSTHHSLREAIRIVTRDKIARLIMFTDEHLSPLLGRRPSIAVAGLNPHASEDGKFGNEEQEHILPAVEECRVAGIAVNGPFSPDTIFLRGHRGEFDAVIAMYHDQATIAVKALSFGHGVNVTLGLPLIRTSVDHGTAYDIAGKGIADATSMAAALDVALEMAEASRVETQIC